MLEGLPRPLASPELLETPPLLSGSNGKFANGTQ
jgi:DNA recombination protein RmuC